VKRDVPIDGVGLQAHFTVGRAPTYDELKASLYAFPSIYISSYNH
jgi:endo-1,4-beta-xylanase